MKRIYLLLCFWLIANIAFGLSTVGNAGGFNPPAAGTICVASNNYILQQFTIAETVAGTNLVSVTFTSAGSYLAADVTNFILWRNTVNNFATATNTSTIAGVGPGAHTFAFAPVALTTGVTYYYWITATFPATAVAGRTISINAIGNAQITITAGPKAGASLAGNVQTINKAPTGVTATAAPNPVCLGSNLTLTGTATGGTTFSWTGPVFTAAVLNPPAFAVTMADAGVYVLAATNVCGTTTASTPAVVVNPLPASITGFTNICIGTTSTMADASAPGTWVSTVPGVATVDAAGVVTGWAAGTSTIIFTSTATGCSASIIVTVGNILPAITGVSSLCQYTTTSLGDLSTGGIWSSSNAVVATVDPITGVVSGLAGGMDTITYTNSVCTTIDVVTVNPVPVPGAIIGTSTICIETGTLLTDTPAGGAWVSGDPLVATIDAFGNVTGLSAGTAVITYNVTNACGTTGATFLMTVEQTVRPIMGYLNLCVGNTNTLTDSTYGGIWSLSNGDATITPLGSAASLVTGVAVGLETVSYTVTNSCGTSTATIIETIGNPVPTGIITGPSVVCIGSSVVFTDPVIGGYWAAGLAGTATVSSSGVVTGVSVGMDTIYYDIMATCGLCSSYHLITVDSFGAPFVAITANPGITSCETIPVTYTANTSFGGTTPTYIWKVNGTFVGVDSFYTYTPSNHDTVTCVMTSNYPCATVPAASNFVITNVIPKVIPTVKVIAGTLGDTVCLNTLDTFFTTSTNAGVAPVFEWGVNGVNITAGTSFVYTPTNFDVISVTLLSNALCAIPDSVKSFVMMRVDTTELPEISISINPSDTVCTHTLVTYTAKYLYGGRHPSFIWIKNGVDVATGPSYTYYASNLDTISCELISNSPCAVPTTVYSNKIIMHTFAIVEPTVSITANPGTLIPYGHNDTLTATVIGAGPSPTFQWVVNGMAVAGATSNVYVLNYVASTNNVTCIVTGSGNCPAAEGTKSISIGIIPSGIRQIAPGINNILLSPNPNSGVFTLQGFTGNDDDLAIEITDVLGQAVYKSTVMVNNGIVDKQINLLGILAQGTYFLHIVSGSENKVIRFTLCK